MDDEIYARLVSIKDNGSDGSCLPLRRSNVYLIGRGLTDDIKILDPTIRTKHCSIDFIEGVGPRIIPSSRSSEVFVNGQLVEGEMILTNGDSIKLGRKTLRIDVRKMLDRAPAVSMIPSVQVPKPQLVDLVSPPRINKVQVRAKTKNKSLVTSITKPPNNRSLSHKIKESPVKRQLFEQDENESSTSTTLARSTASKALKSMSSNDPVTPTRTSSRIRRSKHVSFAM